jgi:hypothetical protein
MPQTTRSPELAKYHWNGQIKDDKVEKHVVIFIYFGLLNEAVSSSSYVAFNDRIISE